MYHKGERRPLMKSPNWMRRIAVGETRNYELIRIDSITAEGAWIIVGGPEPTKRNVTRVFVRNPYWKE